MKMDDYSSITNLHKNTVQDFSSQTYTNKQPQTQSQIHINSRTRMYTNSQGRVKDEHVRLLSPVTRARDPPKDQDRDEGPGVGTRGQG